MVLNGKFAQLFSLFCSRVGLCAELSIPCILSDKLVFLFQMQRSGTYPKITEVAASFALLSTFTQNGI